jgi:EmrB/QacA subfamily drug resistance transporter
MAALDATVVNVALPSIGKDLGADVAGLQWIITGYLITLSALLLIGGSLGDRFGRRRIFRVGVAWFALASVLCSLAPTIGVLVAARILQGVGGALLTPGSLAIIEATFAVGDRARAIGAWSGLGGIAAAIGPLVGGWLVSAVSWRLIFLINVPLAAIVLLAARHVPESTDPAAPPRTDFLGASLAVIGLASSTCALIEGPTAAGPVVVVAAVIGVAGLVAFVLVERRSRHPMLPLELFASRQFSAANLVTLGVYAALDGVLFLLAVTLQEALGYSPIEAGVALLPVTVLMLLFSARAGALAQRIGPRLPMTLGPLIVAVGLLMMRGVSPGAHYGTDILPAVVVFGAGLSLTVAPLTATVLAAAPERHAGVASAVNNAVARVAGLVAVALLPALAGLTGAEHLSPSAFADGFHTAATIGAGLCLAGAAVAAVGIRNPAPTRPVPTAPRPESACPVDAPPLRSN